MRRFVLALLVLPALAGCENSCQALCSTLAEYAEECGTTYPESEIEACVDAWAAPTGEQAETCRDYGQPDVVRRTWTCEDVNLYQDLFPE